MLSTPLPTARDLIFFSTVSVTKHLSYYTFFYTLDLQLFVLRLYKYNTSHCTTTGPVMTIGPVIPTPVAAASDLNEAAEVAQRRPKAIVQSAL